MPTQDGTLDQAESQEQLVLEPVPVKMYQSDDRLTVAAPMPGLDPGDIVVEVTGNGQLILHGRVRGFLKGIKQLLLDEWTVGGYHRELPLPIPVDGAMANVTYGNGVLVVAMPLSQQMCPAKLTLTTVAPDTGQRVGNAGRPPRAATNAEHGKAIGRKEEQHGGPVGHDIYGIGADDTHS
jgi:HSP20 family protein